MKISKLILVLFIALLIAGESLLAQKWSAEQQEVWQTVENWWMLYKNNDSANLKKMVHKDYTGWAWEDYAPAGYAAMVKWLDNRDTKMTKIDYNILRPLEILVMDDVAVLHYYYTTHQTKGDKKSVIQGRWTDIWKKEGGKWLLISDSGGALPKK